MLHKKMLWRSSLLFLVLFVFPGCVPEAMFPLGKDQNTSSGNVSPQTEVFNDEAYVAYRNRYEHSPKIPGMIVSLIQMHMDAGEYLLVRFYCDEYRRDYPSGKDRPKVDFLRAKALFLRYEQTNDERLADQARAEGQFFLSEYRRSLYRSQMEALLYRLQLKQNIRYEKLAEYYEKRNKPKAAKIYRDKIKTP
jgi:outer membrane protein assembly factor BamD